MNNQEFITLLKQQNIKYEIDEVGLLYLISNEQSDDEKNIELIIENENKIEFPDFISKQQLIIDNRSANNITFNNITIVSSIKDRLTIKENKVLETLNFKGDVNFIALNLENNFNLNQLTLDKSKKCELKKLFIDKTKIKEVVGLEKQLLFLSASYSELEKYENNLYLETLNINGTTKFETFFVYNNLKYLSIEKSKIKKVIDKHNSLSSLYAKGSDLENLEAFGLKKCYIAETKIKEIPIEKIKNLLDLDINIPNFEFTPQLLTFFQSDQLKYLNVADDKKIVIEIPDDLKNTNFFEEVFILKENIGQFIFINTKKVDVLNDESINNAEISIYLQTNIECNLENLLDNYLVKRGATNAQKDIFWGDNDAINKRTPEEINQKDALYGESIINYCNNEFSAKKVLLLGCQLTMEEVEKISDYKIKNFCELYLIKKSLMLS